MMVGCLRISNHRGKKTIDETIEKLKSSTYVLRNSSFFIMRVSVHWIMNLFRYPCWLRVYCILHPAFRFRCVFGKEIRYASFRVQLTS